MSSDSSGQPPFMTPPTYPQPFVREAAPSSWPKVIGIIAIVLGSVAALFGLLGMFAPALTEALSKNMPPEQQRLMEVTKQYSTALTLVSLISAVIGTVLLVAGIGLLKRLRRGVKLAIVWSIAKIAYELAYAGLNYRIQIQTWDAMKDDPNLSTVGGGMAGGLAWVTAVATLLFGCAFPIFMLIWFSRRKIKEETASWS